MCRTNPKNHKTDLKNKRKIQKVHRRVDLGQRRKVCKNKDIKSKGEKLKKCKLKHNDISHFKDEREEKWFDTD